MLLKVAEKKVNSALAKKAEAERMVVIADEAMKNTAGEIYAVADGMRAQATDLDLMADKLTKITG